MITSFNEILTSALTPTMLISGVGLMMLCMTNRYNSTTDRIRKLIKRREASGLKNEPCIDTEIRYVFRRAALLRHAMLCISSSAVCTGFLVATSVASHFLDTDLTSLAVLWLFLSIASFCLPPSFSSVKCSRRSRRSASPSRICPASARSTTRASTKERES